MARGDSPTTWRQFLVIVITPTHFIGGTNAAPAVIGTRDIGSGFSEKLSTSPPQKIGIAFGIAGSFLLITFLLWFIWKRWAIRNPRRSPKEIFSKKKGGGCGGVAPA